MAHLYIGRYSKLQPAAIRGMRRFAELGAGSVGAPGGTRTHDLQVRNLALYPLSYGRTLL
jgi:hypothetical protein